MPSITSTVDVDFDWDDVIKSHSNVNDLAAAIYNAGLSASVCEVLHKAIAEQSADPHGPEEDTPDAMAVLDRLVDDYARGLPIDEQLRRVAYTHCGRVITAVH